MARRRFDYTRNNDPGETNHPHGFVSNGKTYTRELHWEIANWCEERFGPPDINYNARWCHIVPRTTSVGIFFFLEEDAAFEFRMRWC